MPGQKNCLHIITEGQYHFSFLYKQTLTSNSIIMRETGTPGFCFIITCTVKHANVVISIKQSTVLKGHLPFDLLKKFSYDFNLF